MRPTASSQNLAGALVLAIACGPPALAQVRSQPIICFGNQEIRLVDQRISASGDAVVARDNCTLLLRRCRLEAEGVAVRASGNASVRIVDSYVAGKGGSLRAGGNSEIEYSHSEIHGRMGASGLGELLDGGGNTLLGAEISRLPPGDPGAQSAGIEIGQDTIRVGGVTIDEEGVRVGGAVVVDEQGISVGAESVVVDADGNVRIDSPEGTILVSGDWRDQGTVYSDTDRVLVELGAVSEEDSIRLDLAGDVLFDFDSSAIRDAAAAQLSRVAHVIRRRAAGRVTVIGHTDSIGTADYNQKLSEDRAMAVIRWLNRVEGVPLQLMAGRGLGAKRPVAHNTMPDGSDNLTGRARNRRVEIQILTGG